MAIEEGLTSGIPKSLLKSMHVLMHYDSSKKLVVSCDTIPCGFGAVLVPDGRETNRLCFVHVE